MNQMEGTNQGTWPLMLMSDYDLIFYTELKNDRGM